MAPNPPATGSKPPAGKTLSLRSPWTWVIIGGIALAGGAVILYRNRKAASAGTGTASTSSPDYSGALGTLQDEIGNLQSGGSSGGGTSVVPVGDPSGGGGSVTPAGGPSSGGNPPGASGGSGSDGGTGSGGSSGGGSTGGGGGTTTVTAPSVTNGRMLSHSASRATIAWDGPGASQWDVTRFGPGSPNGITNRVYAPVAVYTGLAAGHNYYSVIQPIVNGQKAGTTGRVDFNTIV